MRQIIIIAGSNRTGTSLLTEMLIRQGFAVPQELESDDLEYRTHESGPFKQCSRKWNELKATEFVESFPDCKLVLKYPKASRLLKRWLRLLPDARVIYVYRPQEEAVASQIKNFWGDRPFRFLVRWIYRREWRQGYLAVSNLSVPVHFVTFEELKLMDKFDIPQSFGWNNPVSDTCESTMP